MSEPLRFVKVFLESESLNKWVMDTGYLIVSVARSEGGTFTVLYATNDLAEPEKVDDSIPGEHDIPFVKTIMAVGDEKKPAYCMAGVFGVPEGFKLSTTEDLIPAPIPRFSPDFRLYDLPSGWFALRGETNVN